MFKKAFNLLKPKQKMKLGISFNLFDGEELLKGAIESIREHVDFITVIYQSKSYYGNKCSPQLLPLLEALQKQRLIDQRLEFKPNLLVPAEYNELTKRNIGMNLSRDEGCTHHISIDVDEFYQPKQFETAKQMMSEGDFDSSFCQMKTYYHSTAYEISPPEEFYVSLFVKIAKDTRFQIVRDYPFFVDPTRRVTLGKHKMFSREEIQMHHLSYVRKDIRSKLRNSSALKAYEQHIEFIAGYYETWQYPKKALLSGNPLDYQQVVESDWKGPQITFKVNQ